MTNPQPSPTSPRDALEDQLRERFGLEQFRPWQREAIDAVLAKRPALVVAPTGGGKSLTYQFPATQLEGTTIVISPLIALMEDQVRSLVERGVRATFLASTLERGEVRQRERDIADGAYELVYVAPERLGPRFVRSVLASATISMVAIDEAHCISQWGHDFRPDYLRIGETLREWSPPRLLACTATATPRVRDEIIARLHMRDPKVVLRGFARPNLHLRAEMPETKRKRQTRMLASVREAIGAPGSTTGAAIIYAATRKNTEAAGEALQQAGYRAGVYHAGMNNDARARTGDAFASGELDIIAATNAFGMGIDRADIRLVLHMEAPGSIEAYYQEVGRAGRDGKAAEGILLSGTADLGLRRRLLEFGATDKARVEQQWKMFLDLMRYVEAGSCRHDFILRYFEDEDEVLGGCGHCDICEALGDDDPESDVMSDEDVLVVRKALSGVARARGRVGMKLIAEMLAGKDNQKIRRLRMEQLSTFGLLADRGTAWTMQLLRRLITAGYATISAGDYPLLIMTARGASVMKGETPPRMMLPDVEKSRKRSKVAGPSKKPIPLRADAVPLFEALRTRRKELADEREVPAYVVCSNRTLEELASLRPTTLDAMLEAHGMGPARIESYGKALLDVILAN